tara:strand:- start:4583 stop:5215 length:633 start_codon:yes stop_codon:yes gene_type:complete
VEREMKFINSILFTLFLFFIVHSNAFSDNYFKALDFFNSKKIKNSVELFKKVAEDENDGKRSDAMFNLAIIYDNGFGVKKNHTRALFYYETAAQLSNKYAQYNLGWKYYNGEDVNKDVIKAYELYKSAADYGHPQAMFNLANMYYSGTGTVKDLKKAYKTFLLARLNGISESDFFIEEISKKLSTAELSYLNKTFSSLIENKISLPNENQ